MNTMEIVAKKEGDCTEVRVICFICTGNTCRSPMAEAVLNHRASHLKAISRGLCAMGDPIAENAEMALEEIGIRCPDHISKPLDDETAKTADLLVGMTDSHVFSLLSLYPEYASKITRMPAAIPDPFGGDMDTYRVCLAEISRGIDLMFCHD